MTSFDGNLALKPRRSLDAVRTPAGKRGQVRSKPVKARRIRLADAPNSTRTHQQKAKAIQRDLAKQRLKILLGVVALVFAVTGIFGLVVYRQARILEMNFENRSIEHSINQIDEYKGQISEDLAQKTNFDLIRHQAIARLGMQDPAASQIIHVRVPDSDRVVFNTVESIQINDEAYLADVFSSIEGYFRSMNQQRTVD